MFWDKYSGFFRLFLEAQKKIIDPQGPMYTKVSWLEGWSLKTPFPSAFPPCHFEKVARQ
jgi:hypothetical protein